MVEQIYIIYYRKIIKNNVKNGRKLYMKLVLKIIIVQYLNIYIKNL